MKSKRLFSALVSFTFAMFPVVSKGMNVEQNNINNNQGQDEVCVICREDLPDEGRKIKLISC